MESDPEVFIYGFAPSSYVRSARMACIEKGVPHALEPLDLGSDQHRALHPFGKMPAMRHGDFTIWETTAIATYVDRTFDGPPLRPRGTKEEARMTAWCSSTIDYTYPTIIRNIVLERVAERFGRTTDEDKIASAIEPAGAIIRTMERQLARTAHFAGEDLSIADLLIYPIIDYLTLLPEATLLGRASHVSKWHAAMSERKSAKATRPN